MLFSDGFKGPVMKAKNETLENMITVLLKDNQWLKYNNRKRINETTFEQELIDQNGKLFISFLIDS